MKNDFDRMVEKLDHISMQFDYVSKSFSVAIKALEKICDEEEKQNREDKSPYNIAQKALRSIKSLANEACTEDD